jgi:catechol 2,3-dioxygenase-like lactoylglutathione lyase family enzyme
VSARGVRELRLVVTVSDYAAAVAFYRDVLGMPESAEYVSEDAGRVVILEAGRATLEIGDEAHARYIDELEVGRRVAGPVRVALQVDAVDDATSAAAGGGASLVAAAVDTPWGSRNSRLEAPGELHLTLYEDRSAAAD